MIVLRIIDRFNIKGRGMVYTVQNNKDVIVHINDMFYDTVGSRFKVIGIEMLRRCFGNLDNLDELPLGILFELVDGVEVVEDKLFSEKTILINASEQDEGKKA